MHEVGDAGACIVHGNLLIAESSDIRVDGLWRASAARARLRGGYTGNSREVRTHGKQGSSAIGAVRSEDTNTGEGGIVDDIGEVHQRHRAAPGGIGERGILKIKTTAAAIDVGEIEAKQRRDGIFQQAMHTFNGVRPRSELLALAVEEDSSTGENGIAELNIADQRLRTARAAVADTE